jgi:hypothetical protein
MTFDNLRLTLLEIKPPLSFKKQLKKVTGPYLQRKEKKKKRLRLLHEVTHR